MDRVIKNLREQLILLRRLSELLDGLASDLKQSTAGDGVTETVQSIEAIIPELSKTDAKLNEFLRAESLESVNAFLELQPASIERNVAVGLIKQVGNLQMNVQKQLVKVSTLLVNSKKFIDFNINVMSAAAVGPTYGRGGAAPAARSERRIFDANI
ncbi:MAG: flagellar export chaperone FlgN [Selenomonadaceae bacterium]|nr:flagellar export chaperone FlgN [Selenomonadaceae bacterium]